jgi:hypothetical protein
VKRTKHWEAHSRNRAYRLVTRLRLNGVELSQQDVDRIIAYLWLENQYGAKRAIRATRGK